MASTTGGRGLPRGRVVPVNDVMPASSRRIESDAFVVTRDGTDLLTRSQARGRSYIAPSRGVRYARDVQRPEQAAFGAALLGSREDAVLTGLSAARNWDLPLPTRLAFAEQPQPIEVAVLPGSAHPDRSGVRGRRLRMPGHHVTNVGGLPTTSAGRTWLDCAAFVPIEHCIAMGDAVLARQLAGIEELGDLVRWARRRRGVVNARRALPWLEAASESPGESLVRAHLVLHGVERPLCNHEIFWGREWIARVDLCWPDQRLIVEYDGAVHLEDRQRKRDAQRRNRLQEAGWLVITFTSADLGRPWLMVTQVKRALAARTYPR